MPDRGSTGALVAGCLARALAGRDLAEVIGEAGTWMGVAGDGRFAALTQLPRAVGKRTDARSRGELVSGFLRGQGSPTPTTSAHSQALMAATTASTCWRAI
ncbi:NRDE family protein [Cupriavidus basilensis]